MTSQRSAVLPFAPQPDRDSRPYWDGLASGVLKLQRCAGCRALRWPARAICNRCHSFEGEWEGVSGRGRIVSWIRTHRAFAPELADETPYVTVQVVLDEQDDLLLIGAWLGERDPEIEEPVVLEAIEGERGFVLPCWKPATA